MTNLGQDDHWVYPHMSHEFDLWLKYRGQCKIWSRLATAATYIDQSWLLLVRMTTRCARTCHVTLASVWPLFDLWPQYRGQRKIQRVHILRIAKKFNFKIFNFFFKSRKSKIYLFQEWKDYCYVFTLCFDHLVCVVWVCLIFTQFYSYRVIFFMYVQFSMVIKSHHDAIFVQILEAIFINN